MIRLRIPIWSRLTRVQRILLGVVALIVALFVLTVGLGGNRADVNLAEPPAFVERLGSLFGGPPAVEPADVGGDCIAPDPSPSASPAAGPSPSVEPSPSAGPSPAAGGQAPDGRRRVVLGTCVLTVAGRDVDVRELRLTAAGPVRVEAPVPRSDETATKELAAGDELKVSVDSGGASITLVCMAANICAVNVG